MQNFAKIVIKFTYIRKIPAKLKELLHFKYVKKNKITANIMAICCISISLLLLPKSIHNSIWGLCCIFTAYNIGTFNSHYHNGSNLQHTIQGIGILITLYGLLLLVSNIIFLTTIKPNVF